MVPNGKLEVKNFKRELKSETTEQMISTYVHEQPCENRNTTWTKHLQISLIDNHLRNFNLKWW
jgi:hypothetical protein